MAAVPTTGELSRAGDDERLVSHALGYSPGWTRIGEDLPQGVFLEWTEWVMRPRCFLDEATLLELANFPRYRGALCAIGIGNDPWSTPSAIELLVSAFTGTRPDWIQIDRADSIGQSVSSAHHRDTLWRDTLDWLAGS